MTAFLRSTNTLVALHGVALTLALIACGDGAASTTPVAGGTLTPGQWCTTDGHVINCTSAQPVLSETDPKVGALTTGAIPQWDGLALVNSSLADDGAGNVRLAGASAFGRLTNVADPIDSQDVATKAYVDAAGSTSLRTVRVECAGCGTLTATCPAGYTIASGYYSSFSNNNGPSTCDPWSGLCYSHTQFLYTGTSWIIGTKCADGGTSCSFSGTGNTAYSYSITIVCER